MRDLAAAIACENVWKTFRLHTHQKLLRQHLTSWFGGGGFTQFDALKGVSFQVAKGEGLAVIGSNGAGKSTLLSIVTGLAKPDKGKVAVNGRVAALLELGSGFHPDLTGAENVYLNAALLGFSERQTEDMFEDIVEFAGVREFIDEPLRTYSSGMMMRLAFSVAVNVDPDILIIDEVLAVGDDNFQQKCFAEILRLRENGTLFICASHAAVVLRQICKRALWLEQGQLVMTGTIDEVLRAYKHEAHDTVIRPV